ncbi:MAG: hypothetical protein GYB65_19980, partial [Chloroflexi bacterium]|nr:hypothetical protein [Chloroflexota bacterium]
MLLDIGFRWHHDQIKVLAGPGFPSGGDHERRAHFFPDILGRFGGFLDFRSRVIVISLGINVAVRFILVVIIIGRRVIVVITGLGIIVVIVARRVFTVRLGIRIPIVVVGWRIVVIIVVCLRIGSSAVIIVVVPSAVNRAVTGFGLVVRRVIIHRLIVRCFSVRLCVGIGGGVTAGIAFIRRRIIG